MEKFRTKHCYDNLINAKNSEPKLGRIYESWNYTANQITGRMLDGSKWQERFLRYHQVSRLAQKYFDSPSGNKQINGNTCLIT